MLNYRLSGGLSKREIEKIHQGALKVLREVGVDVSHREALKLLSKHNGVTIEGTRVKYQPDLIERCLEQMTREAEEENKRSTHFRIKSEETSELKVATGGLSHHILDMVTGEIRRPLTSDLVEMTKLADSLNMSGVTPLIPQDVPGLLQDLVIHKVCWENSREIGGGRITSLDAANYIYEMAKVVNKEFVLPLWVSSPLSLNAGNLDVIIHFLDRKVPMNVSTMPMMGMTAPIFFPAAIIQGVAEALGAASTLQIMSKGATVRWGIDIMPFDMKFIHGVYGSPEHNLMGLMQLQIARYYGLSGMVVIRGFKGMGKGPDAQSGAERAMGVLAGALIGARYFFAAGRICGDEIFSGEQLVIDKEIVNYVSRFIKGFDFKNDELSFKVIKEVGVRGNYLSHPTTLEDYRQAFRIPELFEYSPLALWRKAGGKSIRERVQEIARKKITEHHFTLDKDIQRELDRIYKRAKESLL